MGWFGKLKNRDETPADRADAEPQFIEGDGEEGAEVVFTESTPTTPTKPNHSFFGGSPTKTLPEEEDAPQEDFEGQQASVDVDANTTSSASLAKDLEENMELRNRHIKKVVAFLCVILVILAIILGIVLGSQDKDTNIPPEMYSGLDAEIKSPNLIANEECNSAIAMGIDGSWDVGIISVASESSFVNGEGQCGQGTFGAGKGAWYSASGNGGKFSLRACVGEGCSVPENSLVIPEVSVFTGDCNGLLCVAGVANLMTDGPLIFNTIRGQEYFIFIQGREGSLGVFEISLEVED